MYPLGRPEIWQRFFKRTLEEFFGNSSKAFQSPAFFSTSRLAAYCATIFSLFLCLAFTDVFAIIVFKFQILKSPFLQGNSICILLFISCVFKRHSQFLQYFISLFICISC